MPSDDLQYAAKVRGYTQGEVAFGRFALMRMVGRGGMGVVWQAWDNRLERDVALKFLPEKLRLDEKSVEALRRETRRCLSLTHPNIVRTYDFHVDDQTAAMAMEFVDGETLSVLRMKQPGQVFMPSALIEWLKQVSDALTYAYRHEEVVHLDLKPANLMIDRRGQLKITDFGIASTVTDSLQRLAPDEDLCGSPPYMSPQQIMGEPPSVSDDIYSLGVTIYEMLTGKPPFHGEKILQQIMNAQPVGIALRRTELMNARSQKILELEPIPPHWEEMVLKCLAKQPEGRPASMIDLVEGLLPPKPRVRLPGAKKTERTHIPGSVADPLASPINSPTSGTEAVTTPAPIPSSELVDVPAPTPGALTNRRRWLFLALLILALLVFFWAGISAVFSAEPPPAPAPAAEQTSAEDENAMIPNFLAPVTWSVTRGEIKKLRPAIEINEDPIQSLSDRSEIAENFIINYMFPGKAADVDQKLSAIYIMPIEGVHMEEGPPQAGSQGYELINSALAKYGPPTEVRTKPWLDNAKGLFPHATLGKLLWAKGNTSVTLNVTKDQYGKILSRFAILIIKHGDPLKVDPDTVIDTDNTFLSPEVMADLKANTGPGWK